MSFLVTRLQAFLRHTRAARFFGHRAMPQAGAPAASLDEAQARALMEAAGTDADVLLRKLGGNPGGLSAAEVVRAREVHGRNVMSQQGPPPWWLHLWRCYANPFNLLLSVLAAVCYVTDDLQGTVVIGAMVLVSTLLRYIQEGRSHRAAERLKALVSNRATVIRRGKRQEAHEVGARYFGLERHDDEPGMQVDCPMEDLVPGDLVVLSAGDMIPSDCRVLSAKDLFVSQSALTGESLPVEKSARSGPVDDTAGPLGQVNLLFMGTNVVSGTATALVLSTGHATAFAALAAAATAEDRQPTAFQAGVNSVSWLLIRFAMVMVPVVLVANGITKGDWTEAFLFALSVAVGLTPEMLPMIVTSTLAKGAVQMSRKKVIVKRLDAIQNFGAMDVLCTDKTGTLTRDKIVLERHTDAFGQHSDEVLPYAFLNSHHQTGLKNLLDRAVLEHAGRRPELDLGRAYAKVDEIPFDFERRRMSVILAGPLGRHLLVCKGAVEEMLAACSRVRTDGAVEAPLDAAMLARVGSVTRDLNASGLRVVAVAVKEMPPVRSDYGVADESDLTLVGYVAFLDPPKESTAPALEALARQGVAVKVLTGDNDLVAAEVCRQVGLTIEGTLLGPQIDRLDEEGLRKAARHANLFARLSPSNKERLVRALRAEGHVVGFMGDGINDAPALRAADVGISVDTAVDIAKDAADIILLERSLLVLEQGVSEGRRVFCNMLKYIRMTASSNFGNVFSVLVASIFLPFLPMLPIQLLVQNLLYDVSQVAIPFDNVDSQLVERPLRWNPADIGRFMLFFGPLSSVFDVLTFVVMWHVFGADSPAQAALFQSGWFVVGLVTQTLIVHLIRTPRIPLIESRAAWPLLAMTGAIITVAAWLPQGPWAGSFGFVALPASYFPWLAAIVGGYVALTTVMKRYYIRRYGWQ